MEEKFENILDKIRRDTITCADGLHLELRALYLFGSFGTVNFKSDSDLDLGILCSRALTAQEKMQMIRALDLPGGHVVDLVDLCAVDLEMQDIIISERRRIYTNPKAEEAVEDYEHYVWVMYLTACEDTKEIINEIKRTGIIYGPDYIEKGRIRKPVYKTH